MADWEQKKQILVRESQNSRCSTTLMKSKPFSQRPVIEPNFLVGVGTMSGHYVGHLMWIICK